MKLVGWIGVAAIVVASPWSHAQQGYPSKPIRMIIPLAAASAASIRERRVRGWDMIGCGKTTEG